MKKFGRTFTLVTFFVASSAQAFKPPGTFGGSSGSSSSSSTPTYYYLSVAPLVGYRNANLFGQGTVPTYQGLIYGGEAEFYFGGKNVGFSIFGDYRMSKLKNTANVADQSEELDETIPSFGIRMYSRSAYAELGYGQIQIKDIAAGTINNTLTFKSPLYRFGVGYSFVASDSIKVILGIEANYAKFTPQNSSVTSRQDDITLGALLKISFTIPNVSSEPVPPNNNSR